MKIRSLLGTCLLLATASVVQALGLGEIQVKSRLNQPLEAEIVVREAFPGEAEHLTVRLASAEDFARIGLERSWIPSILNFETVADDRGRKVIRITSQDPIREPNLSLLIDANWSGGRLLREYGVLLDPVVSPQPRQLTRPAAPPSVPAAPPVQQQPAQAPTPTPAPAPAPAPTPAPAPAPTPPPAAPAPAAPAPTPAPAPPASPPPTGFADPAAPSRPAPATPPTPATPTPAPSEPTGARGDGTYTVARGDTLSAIAYELASDLGVNTNQMMLALQRQNPNAFFANNINALKAGSVLRVPDASELRSVTAADARVEVRRQLDSWSGQSGAPTLADPGSASSTAATAASPAAPAQARVELLSPRSDDGAGSTSAGGTGSQTGGAQVAEVEADLKRAREELTSRSQEVSELTSRVRDLEELNSQNARLLELKNAEVAALQRRLAEAAGESAPAQAVTEATADASSDVAPATTDPVEAAPAEAPEPAPSVAETEVEVAAEEVVAEATPTGESPAEEAAEAASDESTTETTAAESDVISGAGMDEAVSPDQSEQDWEAAATAGGEDPFAAEESAQSGATPSATPAQPPSATPATIPSASLTPAPTPTEQPFYMNPLYQGAALVLLALILALVLLSRRGRRNSEALDPVPAKRSVSDMFAPTAATGAAAVEARDGDELTLDEAEVAELVAHIQANPHSHDSYIELLSIFYANGDTERFSHWAQRLRQQVSGDSAEWQVVADMGRELLPDEPLFAEGAAVSELDETVAAWTDAIAREEDEIQPDEPVVAKSWLQEDDVIDLGEPETRIVVERTEEIVEIADGDDSEDGDDTGSRFQPLEFDLDGDEVRAAPVETTVVDVVEPNSTPDGRLPPLEFDSSFDIDQPRDSTPRRGIDTAGGDDVATKLELARAYLDMGDPDGARAMLEEVLGEGDTAQREQAARLLDSI